MQPFSEFVPDPFAPYRSDYRADHSHKDDETRDVIDPSKEVLASLMVCETKIGGGLSLSCGRPYGTLVILEEVACHIRRTHHRVGIHGGDISHIDERKDSGSIRADTRALTEREAEVTIWSELKVAKVGVGELSEHKSADESGLVVYHYLMRISYDGDKDEACEVRVNVIQPHHCHVEVVANSVIQSEVVQYAWAGVVAIMLSNQCIVADNQVARILSYDASVYPRRLLNRVYLPDIRESHERDEHQGNPSSHSWHGF